MPVAELLSLDLFPQRTALSDELMNVTRTCTCKTQLAPTISIILCICRFTQGFIATFRCRTDTVLKCWPSNSNLCESNKSFWNMDWPWTQRKCMKIISRKMKHTVIVIGNSLKWSSHLKQSSFKKTKKTTCVRIRFPLKRKTNLSLAPARLKLWETKRVLCQCLQQDHEARLATSRWERIDFTTHLGIYFAVTMDWRDANGCPGTVFMPWENECTPCDLLLIT